MEGAFARAGAWLVDARVFVLVVVGLLTCGFGYFCTKVEINTANEYFFVENDPFLTAYADYKATFGSDEFVYILLSTGETFDSTALKRIDRLSEVIRQKVPFVTRVRSIIDAERIASEDDSIVVEPLIGQDGIEASAERLKALRTYALDHDMYTGTFVSQDAAFAGIIVETEVREGDGVYRKTLTDAIRKVADAPEFASFQPRIVGPPIMDADVDRILAFESRFFGFCSFGIIIFVLLVTFRRVLDVLAPMLVIFVTNVWVIGLMGVFDIPITMMSIVLPGVIVVVGCGDAIHVIAEYRGHAARLQDVRAAVIETVRLTGLPCLFTSLTTMVGFGSLMAMDLRPGKEMGMFAAIGVVIAFFMTYLLLPPLMSFSSQVNLQKSQEGFVHRWFEALLEAIAGVVVRRRRLIIGIGLVAFVAGLAGLSRVIVAADILRTFDETTRLRRDYDAVDASLGGTGSVELVLDTGSPDGIYDPKFLAELHEFDTWLSNRDIVKSTTSVLDVFEQLNKVAHDGDPAYEKPPDTRPLAAQLFLLYETGGAEDIDRLVTPERDKIHIAVRTVSVSTAEFKHMLNEIEDWVGKNMTTVKYSATGVAPLFVRMVHYITTSQIASFSVAFVAVTLMMILLFRSVGMGLLAMVPNVVPIAITFGYMGVRGITLNVGTVMIASIAIGIAVDDSIHFVSHYRHHTDEGLGTEAAIRATLLGVGRALLTTSVVLTVGFSVFGLSAISHLTNFGLLTALTVVGALSADFLLLPALLLTVSRK